MTKSRRCPDIFVLVVLAASGACDAGQPLQPQGTDNSKLFVVDQKGSGGAAGGAGGAVGGGIGGGVGGGAGGGSAIDGPCPCSRAPGRKNPPTTLSCPAGTGVSATATIGPEGGTLSLEAGTQGVTLELIVPPGALATETAISVTELPGSTPAGYTDYTPVYKFEPIGLRLAAPAKIRLPWSIVLAQGAGLEINPALSVYLSGSALDGFERLSDSYINAGFCQASLDRLGYLFGGYPATLDPQSCN